MVDARVDHADADADADAHALDASDASGDFALQLDGITAGYWDTIVVRDASLAVRRGHIVGLAGESGSGKSTLALAAMGVRSGGLTIHGGRSLVGGDDLLALGRRELRSRWGSKLAYVPQGAAASLNPTHTVATHFRLVFRRHLGLRRRGSTRARSSGWSGSGFRPTRCAATPISSRAASNSGSRSRSRCRAGPKR